MKLKKLMNISESGGCGGPGQPPCPEDAIEFTVNYLKSPKYRERLEKSGYNDIDKLIKDRIDRIEKTKIVQFSGLPKTATEKLNSALTGLNYSNDPQSMYNPMISSILVNKFQADRTDSSIGEVIAHELGHAEISARMDNPDVIVPAAVSMNYNDLSEMRKRNRIKRQNDLEPRSWEDRKNRHESNPEEVKGDLNALRYLLNKEGIYDAGKEDFTKEHLKKAPKSFTRDRLLEKYSEEDVIWLMNNIADNSETGNFFYGQEGGMMDPPENYYKTLAMIESGNNPNAKAKTSSAAGLYQFTKGTWDSLVKDLGLNYTLEDRLDPVKSRKVVEEFTRRNERSLKNKLGRNPNEAELYLAHFSGAGGARKLLDTIGTNPEAPVTDFVSKAALKANKNVFFNEDGSPKKAYEIYNWSAKKFGSPVLKPVEPEQPEKTAPQNVRKRKEVVKDNTAAVTKPIRKIPDLATPPINPTYAPLPETKKEEPTNTAPKSVTEEQIRELLAQERQAIESRFTEALRQQQVADQPEEDYIPQLQDVSHLYNYIDVENYKYGGKKECGGPGQPPCNLTKEEIDQINQFVDNTSKLYKENELRMVPGQTANTWGNMFGNLGKYFFNIEDEDLKESLYKPTVSSNNNIKYYTRPGLKEEVFLDLTSPKVKKNYNHSGEFDDIYKGLKSNGEDRKHNADIAFPKNKAGYKGLYNRGHGSFRGEFNLGRYKVDAGEDENGRYISFYDVYDWNGMQTDNKIPFYDRIYEKEWEEYKTKKH